MSKTRVDKAGAALAKGAYKDEIDFIELEDLFDEYRKIHLMPLTKTTGDLQNFLSNFNRPYYIAQRLKRKPQIVRKLKRLSTRLSQLQDIGGCRIIVPNNEDVDEILGFVSSDFQKKFDIKIRKVTDYRKRGRDKTGYRALHFIFERDGVELELQVRSRVQHHWAESIERASVIYGYHLKEEEGDPFVIRYFQLLSDVFYEIESGREPPLELKQLIDTLKAKSESIIKSSDRGNIFDSYVNEGIVKMLAAKELASPGGINNWILIFNWNIGSFVSWDVVSRNPEEAMAAYVDYETRFPADEGFEVVLIGSSDISTVSKTHSHYFGIEGYDDTLQTLKSYISGFVREIDIDIGARNILRTMHRKNFWGSHKVSSMTLKNHNNQDVLTFDSSLRDLVDKQLVIEDPLGRLSLNTKFKARIESYI